MSIHFSGFHIHLRISTHYATISSVLRTERGKALSHPKIVLLTILEKTPKNSRFFHLKSCVFPGLFPRAAQADKLVSALQMKSRLRSGALFFLCAKCIYIHF